MEWKPVLYNGHETNVEVTKCGKVRRIRVDWMKYKTKIGIVDFSKLKLHSDGYQQLNIQIKGFAKKTIQVQQLISSAFLGYNFGNFPNEVVMHIDDNPLNNNLSNLKIGTNRENSSQARTIKSGLPVGVYFIKDTKKYHAKITINNKQFYLGSFKTIEGASNAYQTKLLTINQ